MPSPSLDALYNAAPNILWVEDALTAIYLDAVWQHDRTIKAYIAGGHETIKAVVEDAVRAGRSRVFGLRDRDFGPTNRPRWSGTNVRMFVLETFEVECFLLDPPALATCVVNTSARDEAWIRAHLDDVARSQLWWMACRKVLADLRQARQARFPAHPKPSEVSSREDAERIVLDNEWTVATVPRLSVEVRPDRLRAALVDAHRYFSSSLTGASWVRAFSGKELVHDLLPRLFTRGRPAGSAALHDLAKAVARRQVATGSEPSELVELRQVIKTRATSDLR